MFILYCLSFPFHYQPTNTPSRDDTTKQPQQWNTQQEQPKHPAPHEYPLISRITAYYPLSLLHTNHNIITANIAFILYYNKVYNHYIVNV